VRAALSTRWSKERRAELSWQMLRQLRPKVDADYWGLAIGWFNGFLWQS